ncbi:ABC transporter ATP-binding protein [Agromyces bauzanensis]|uniref:ABC transporter ATP-binding protein n=1 Tax=Agromyces bauzanensis TaxID=1308924 RepID=A0A917UT61_9MICO|nr:ABC transporter ATP-binding protein [Agromyces bauzanensis]GGJ83527.1 ABC transporter ATP-binding protein [Agromyces bauzanensis]
MTAGTDQRPLLSTRALTKNFRGFTAVRHVDLDVAVGSIHALVGPNGAGKTTLFNLLSGFLTPTSGTIILDGQDITGKQPENIAHLGVARSFQITSLFDNLTALEHLELALASPTGLGLRFWRSSRTLRRFRTRSLDLLDKVGMTDLADRNVGEFAYGQKRALELALALALDPKLLLLDEPTAGMSLEDVDRTIELVKQISAGRTVVFVDHNMHVVGSLADRVSVLQQGEILVEGTYDEVRTDEKVITAYLGQAQ